MAHNEEANISNLIDSLLNQTLRVFELAEIIIVSAACTDKTDELINQKISTCSKIKLIHEETRSGKYHAINLFLKQAQSSIIVMISADTLPCKNALEHLCLPLLELDVGICGAKIIPLKTSNTVMHNLIKRRWDLHHQVSLVAPKFGELIAFKKVFQQLPPTIVDEEEIVSIIKQNNLHLRYVPDAIVYNAGPDNFRELFRQRRRIYSGHMDLKNRTGYLVPTMRTILVLKIFLKNLSWPYLPIDLLNVGIEIISRFVGRLDLYLKKHQHYIWKIIPSTKKNLREYQ